MGTPSTSDRAEFIEIDPVVLGLEDFHDVEDEEERKKLLELTRVDKERLRAVHGTAILSRYPIRDASLRPFEMRAYDWYRKEQGIRPVEKGFRVGSTLIGSPMAREMRRGGRTTLTVELYAELVAELGEPVYERIDAPASPEQKARLKALSPEQVRARELAGDPITEMLTTAPGNGASIGGLKVATAHGWFAARPSGTEDVYKLYAESFRDEDHLKRIQREAQDLVATVLA